jgi:hypothetical protein
MEVARAPSLSLWLGRYTVYQDCYRKGISRDAQACNSSSQPCSFINVEDGRSEREQLVVDSCSHVLEYTPLGAWPLLQTLVYYKVGPQIRTVPYLDRNATTVYPI